jgi:hypothetical protein
MKQRNGKMIKILLASLSFLMANDLFAVSSRTEFPPIYVPCETLIGNGLEQRGEFSRRLGSIVEADGNGGYASRWFREKEALEQHLEASRYASAINGRPFFFARLRKSRRDPSVMQWKIARGCSIYEAEVVTEYRLNLEKFSKELRTVYFVRESRKNRGSDVWSAQIYDKQTRELLTEIVIAPDNVVYDPWTGRMTIITPL